MLSEKPRPRGGDPAARIEELEEENRRLREQLEAAERRAHPKERK